MWSTIISGTTWTGEICNINKQGKPYWIERTINPILDDSNHPEYFLAISKDITQQKSLIRKLKNRAQQQSLIAILGQLSITSHDIQLFIEQTLAAVTGALNMSQGRIFELSEDASQALLKASTTLANNREPESPVALSGEDILSYTLLQKKPVSSRSLNSDNRFKLPDIIKSDQPQSALSICIGDGNRTCAIMILQGPENNEITSDDIHFAQSVGNLVSDAIIRHDMQSQLIREKELARQYLDVADIIIIAIDETGNIILANQKASQTLGLEQVDLLGMNWFNYFVPYEDREKARRDFSRFLHDQPVETASADQGYQSTIVTGQAKTRIIKWNNSVIHDNNGEPSALLCAGEDITDIIEANRSRAKMREKLFEAQKMEALGILAGGIAHDFNNILASILGYTDLAMERFASDGNKKLKEYLQHIRDSGIRARDIILQMQSYNQPEQSEFKVVDLSTSIKKILKMMRSAIPAPVNLELHLDTTTPGVLVDPSRINQLLMNLVINARNALMDNGNITIALKKASNYKGECISCGDLFSGDYVELLVFDSGEDRDVKELAHILASDPNNISSSDVHANRLASIHEIVHESRGHIQVDSEPGKGSEFRVYFRIATDDINPPAQDLSADSTASDKHSGARIMIVDDEKTVGRFLGELCNRYGFKSTVFSDSTKALKSFMQHPEAYDLVISDLSMPAMGGDELSRQILEKRADIPIIICTGQSDTFDQQQAEAMNIRGFFKKPVEASTLLARINQLLDKQSAGSP